MTTYTRQLPCGMEVELNVEKECTLFGKEQNYFPLHEISGLYDMLSLAHFIQEETREDSETERGLLFVAIAQFLADHERDIVG